MAVPEQTPYQEYTANGVATSFAVAFQCLSKDTLIVTINGVEQSSVLWNFTGGNVVFIAAPANLSIIGIKRSTALSREITYQTHDNSFRPSVLNGDIDRLWHVLQENQLIYDKKVDKDAQIQTLGNLQGGGAIGLGLTLSLKDQTVTADYQFGSSIKIPVITLNQDGTVKSLHEVDVIGGGGGAFQIRWGDVLNKPTTLNGYGITDAYTKSETYTKTEANTTFIENSEKAVASGVAPLDANVKVDPIYLPTLPNTAIPKATETALGVVELATQGETNTGTDDERAITPQKMLGGLRSHLNASGNAPMYACRAWVNFNGTGTVAIRASGNVSSITDNGVGLYKVNFTTAMQDVNYSAVANYNNANTAVMAENDDNASCSNYLTTSVNLAVMNGGAAALDAVYISVSIIR